MKKILFVFFFMQAVLYASLAFCVDDGTFHRERSVDQAPVLAFGFRTAELTPTPLPKSLAEMYSEDEYNVYFYSENFRVIVGRAYAESEDVIQLAANILDVAESGLHTSISDGYRTPRNMDEYFVDIYLGNRRAYKLDLNYAELVTLNSWYAGYTDEYGNGTPYIVLNPESSSDVQQITVVHELHHAVQFAYRRMEDIPRSDYWFLEMSAVATEKRNFPQSTDYVRFVDDWYSSAHSAIDTFNGVHEYGEVIFALFLKDLFGEELFISVFEAMEMGYSALDGLKMVLENIYETPFADVYSEFMKRTVSPEQYFEDGHLFPGPVLYSWSSLSTLRMYEYGIRYLQRVQQGDLYTMPTIGRNLIVAQAGMDDIGVLFRYGVYRILPDEREEIVAVSSASDGMLCFDSSLLTVHSDFPPVVQSGDVAPLESPDEYLTIQDAVVALKAALGRYDETELSEMLEQGDVAPLQSGGAVGNGRMDIGDAVVLLRASVDAVNWESMARLAQ